LFGAFQQVDNSTKKSFGGTGLGLAISRELCRLMKGDMGVVSGHGQGSTFWFTIEVRSTTISPSISENGESEIKLTNFFKVYAPKILLVDDNQVNRKVASEILHKSGCQVITADSGAKAIEVFGANIGHFDLVFMDIQMPEMDGIETTKKLRELYGKTLPKVVAMTAYSMQHDRERFLSEGMDDYVPKPIRAAILVQKVRELVSDPEVVVELTEASVAPACETSHRLKEEKLKNEKLKPELPVFDMEVVNQLREMVGDETLISVFEDFEREAEEQILNAKNAYPDDVKTIQRELHTLKGNSGTIGLARIHEITETIEVPSKIGDLKHFLEGIAVLEKEFEVFRETYHGLI
jgi:CheY-like chemotaxis protein